MRSASFAAFLISAALPSIATALTDGDANKFDAQFARRTVGGGSSSAAGSDLEARDADQAKIEDYLAKINARDVDQAALKEYVGMLQGRDLAAQDPHLQKRFWGALLRFIPNIVQGIGSLVNGKKKNGKVKREDMAVFLTNMGVAKRDLASVLNDWAKTHPDTIAARDTTGQISNPADKPAVEKMIADWNSGKLTARGQINNPADKPAVEKMIADWNSGKLSARDVDVATDAALDNAIANFYNENAQVIARDLAPHMNEKRFFPLLFGLLGAGSTLFSAVKKGGKRDLDLVNEIARRNTQAGDKKVLGLFNDDGSLIGFYPANKQQRRDLGLSLPPGYKAQVMAVYDQNGNVVNVNPGQANQKRAAPANANAPLIGAFDLQGNLVRVVGGSVQKRDASAPAPAAPANADNKVMAIFNDDGSLVGYYPAKATKRDLPAGVDPKALALFNDDGSLIGVYPPKQQKRDLGEEADADEADVDEAFAEEADADEADADEAYADEAYADEADADEAYADEAYADEADADEAFADEADADEAYADEADADEADADEADFQDALRKRDEEAYADEADADEAYADEADADEAYADEADADEAYADEADADEAFAEEADADEAFAEEADADEANADEAEADEADAEEAAADDEADAADEQLVRRVVGMRGAPIGWARV